MSLYMVTCDVIGLRYLSFKIQNDSKRNVDVSWSDILSVIEIETDPNRNKKMISFFA